MCQSWNYLRVRGEYIIEIIRQLLAQELPPRARRIQLLQWLIPYCVGTTSACAENTVRYQSYMG